MLLLPDSWQAGCGTPVDESGTSSGDSAAFSQNICYMIQELAGPFFVGNHMHAQAIVHGCTLQG